MIGITREVIVDGIDGNSGGGRVSHTPDHTMTAMLAPVRILPVLEIEAVPVRLAVKLAPCAYGSSVPREVVLQPHGEGRVRLFTTDGATMVVIDAPGHCAAPVALGTREVMQLLQRHSDAELFTVSPAAEGDWSWRVRTFSPSMTCATELKRGQGIDTEVIKQVVGMGDGETEGTGGTWSVMALKPLAKLLMNSKTKGERLDRVGLTTAGTDGPLVATFTMGECTGKVVTMRCGERK